MEKKQKGKVIYLLSDAYICSKSIFLNMKFFNLNLRKVGFDKGSNFVEHFCIVIGIV